MMHTLKQLRSLCSQAIEGKDIITGPNNIVVYKEGSKVYMRVSPYQVEELKGNEIVNNWDDELDGSIIQVVLDTKDSSYVGIATDRGYECALS